MVLNRQNAEHINYIVGNVMKNILLIVIFGVYSVACAQKTAEQYIQSASMKQTMKDYKGAIEDYSKAIELKKNDADVYLNRGNCRYQAGLYVQAIADFSKTIQLTPQNAKAYFSRAVSYASLARHGEALIDAEKVVELDPATPNCLTLRGQLRAMNGNKKGACQDFATAKTNGDKSADKYIAQYCSGPQPQKGEILELNWPANEHWKMGEWQNKGQLQVRDLVREEARAAGWREVANMTIIKGAKGLSMDSVMKMMYAQAKNKALDAKLTFIEKDEKAVYPWIIFTIEASKFYNSTPPESQLWYIVQGKEAVYTNFRAIKKPSIPPATKKKWAAFFKTGKILRK